MVTLATDADNGAQLSIYDAPREILTSGFAAGNLEPAEMSKFACPRCRADAVERFYGPCSRCRAELRGDSVPASPRARHRAPERPWRVPAPAELSTIGHAGELVERFRGVESVWLTRPALDALGLGHELGRGEVPAWFAGALDDGWQCRAVAATTKLWRGELDCRVVVPAWDRGSPWHLVDDAGELDAALERFWRLVGVAWGYSGAITSDELVRALTGRTRRTRVAPAVVPEPAAGRRQIETDFAWCRPALVDELDATHAIAFDVNGAYLSAASSLALPAGEPQHHAGPISIDARVPGLWRITPPAPADGWPDPFRPQPLLVDVDEVWATTPIAALAGELGCTADEAWVWPEHRRYLDGWYKALRDARSELVGSTDRVDVLALDAVKATYRQGIGRLGSTRRTRTTDELLQPVWRSLVIAMARARLWRRVRAAPRPPFAIGTDAVWWFAHTSDPHELAAELGLELSTQLGKWKPAGVVAGDAARELVSGAGDVWQSIARLRELAG